MNFYSLSFKPEGEDVKKGLSTFIVGMICFLALSGCQNLMEQESLSDYSIQRSLTSESSNGIFITEISDSSRYQSEFVEIYNSTSSDYDISDWVLYEYRGNSTSSTSYSTIALNGVLKAKSFLIIARDDSRSSFESNFNCSLASSVNYIDSNNGLIINKTYQKFVLTKGSVIIDNYYQNFLSNKNKVANRIDLSDFSDSTFSYTTNSTGNATPGSLSTDQSGILNTTDTPVTKEFDDFNNYYTQAEGLTGSALKSMLHNIIDDHKTVSYDTVWTALKETDEDPDNSNNVILLYKQTSQAKNTNGGDSDEWNREHVWAKSHGDFGEYRGAGTDLHHIRPTDVSVNRSRDSLGFDDGGDIVSEAPLCRIDSNSWEPPDEVKGDVARMIFYMVVRYEGDDYNLSRNPDLELVDYSVPTGSDYGAKDPILGKLSTLLEWHKNDPVSDFERTRNEIIYTNWQYNRNPFIDHPEWVEDIW